jgi:hypothetical protein
MRLPLALCTKKNLLHDIGAWIVLLDVNLSPILNYTAWAVGIEYEIDDKVEYRGVSYNCKVGHTSVAGTYPPNDFTNWEEIGMLRLCEAKNLNSVTWPTSNGYLYTRFQFDIDNVSEENSGEVPTATLKISNVSGFMETYADTYNGFKSAKVLIRVVHTSELDERAIPAHTYSILTSGTNDQWMSFSLGAINPHREYALRDLIYKSFCRYEEFQGILCRFGQNVWIVDRPYNQYSIWNDRPDGESPYVPYRAKTAIPVTESTTANRPCLNSTDWEDMTYDENASYGADTFCYYDGEWYEPITTASAGWQPDLWPTVWKVLTCDRSLDTCRDRFYNTPYFGAFVGLASGGIVG